MKQVSQQVRWTVIARNPNGERRTVPVKASNSETARARALKRLPEGWTVVEVERS